MTIPHWSYSALRQYLDCPLRFFFQRVLALPEKSVSVNLVAGSAVHAALADYYEQQGDAAQAEHHRQLAQPPPNPKKS